MPELSGKPALKIVIVSSGQPSLNPRLVKEADTLSNLGYKVTVLYQYWNEWGTKMDNRLLRSKKWKAIRVGGSPTNQKMAYLVSSIIFKISGMLFRTTGHRSFAETAVGRSCLFLSKKACSLKADLYIGHNLAALPAVVKAAKRNNSRCGFDAEDLHRHENSDDERSPEVKIKQYIEEKYMPSLDYLSTASPLITAAYKRYFPSIQPVQTILNVFPSPRIEFSERMEVRPLRLFWFSQTIGNDRGLDRVIQAIGSLKPGAVELHLLGAHDQGLVDVFEQLAIKYGADPACLFYYHPVFPDEIFQLAARFDIGVASEKRSPQNRDICLTNKVFTYLQSGLTVVASKTRAQEEFIQKYPAAGLVYDAGTYKELAAILENYIENPELLNKARRNAFTLATETLNWESEQLLLKDLVANVLKE